MGSIETSSRYTPTRYQEQQEVYIDPLEEKYGEFGPQARRWADDTMAGDPRVFLHRVRNTIFG